MERISIFVPVYFRANTVRKCAMQLLRTYRSEGYDVRIIFADNRSDDELREFLSGLSKGNKDVTTVLFDNNEGKGPAINAVSKKFNEFDWFISCDSDIFPLVVGWPGILADCFKGIDRAGMLSVAYSQQNCPMPKQPELLTVKAKGKDWKFHWGGAVAGGCFLTSASIWNHLGYRCSGVYGGVDGVFRQNVADSLKRKCGFIEGLVVEHCDDRAEFKDYHKWKQAVQDKIKVLSPLAAAKDLGNDRGFWDK